MLDDEPPHISIAAGVIVGLVASFVQSLGLTLQRSSHVSNERLPPSDRRRDWQRPLWLGGFLLFIVSNVFGTLFQIGALPIVVLGPLGAVSLLWNAFFARIILGDAFTLHLLGGTLLIAGGAVLIGIFGVVPEITHTLPELVALYRRPAFVLFLTFLFTSIALVLLVSHVTEYRLERELARLPPDTPKLKRAVRRIRPGGKRRWSAPILGVEAGLLRREGIEIENADEVEVSGGGGTKGYGATEGQGADERAPLLPREGVKHAHFASVSSSSASVGRRTPPTLDLESQPPPISPEALLARFDKVRVWLAIGYGGISGTLSGLCLLFTKTGIELLILTIVGKNQFGHWESWMILLVLLACELFQLSYLNRALRLVGPTLVCPLAFCFYNTTSIASGLIYYRQVDALSVLQVSMVVFGVLLLLAGVWLVSVKTGKKDGVEGEGKKGEQGGSWTTEPEGMEMDEDEDGSEATDEDDLAPYRPRGFSIGLGAASPGFDIRPAAPYPHHHHLPHLRRPRNSTFTSSESMPVLPTQHSGPLSSAEEQASLSHSTGSLPLREGKRRYAHRRGNSLSGGLYVGEGIPCAGPGDLEGLGLRGTDAGADEFPAAAVPATKEEEQGWWKRLVRGSATRRKAADP